MLRFVWFAAPRDLADDTLSGTQKRAGLELDRALHQKLSGNISPVWQHAVLSPCLGSSSYSHTSYKSHLRPFSLALEHIQDMRDSIIDTLHTELTVLTDNEQTMHMTLSRF